MMMRFSKKILLGMVTCAVVLSLSYNAWLPTGDEIHSSSTMFWQEFLSSTTKRYGRHRQPAFPKNENNLLDIKRFEFVQNNEDICDNDDDLFASHEDYPLILFLVHSAREHFPSRKAIRETWGSVRGYGKWKFRLVFLLGLPKPIPPTNSTPHVSFAANSSLEEGDISVANQIKTESQMFGDIIIGNFVDVYRNMTYKHLMGYKWVLNHCSWATAVVRTDDDMFIDVFQLSGFLQEKSNETSSLFCVLMTNRLPERNPRDKWVATHAEYKDKVYPDYCLGALYITRPNLIDHLYSVKNSVKFFWIDDVYVTGMLRTHPGLPKPNIKITDISNRYMIYELPKREKHWKKEWMFFLAPRDWVPKMFKKLWNKTLLNIGKQSKDVTYVTRDK